MMSIVDQQAKRHDVNCGSNWKLYKALGTNEVGVENAGMRDIELIPKTFEADIVVSGKWFSFVVVGLF